MLLRPVLVVTRRRQVNEDPETLFQPRNIIGAGWSTDAFPFPRDTPSHPFPWRTISGDCAISQPPSVSGPMGNLASATPSMVNGVNIGSIGNVSKGSCSVLLHEFDLARTPVASGQALYLAVQANVRLEQSGTRTLKSAGQGPGRWGHCSACCKEIPRRLIRVDLV